MHYAYAHTLQEKVKETEFLPQTKIFLIPLSLQPAGLSL